MDPRRPSSSELVLDRPVSSTVAPSDGVPSTRRWLLALAVGTLLWFAAVALSFILPQTLLGLRLQGWSYGVVGVLQLALALPAIALALRVVGLRLRDAGLTGAHWRADAAIGVAVAVGFALLQFLVIIPNTGGATRSDVAMNAAQIGESLAGVVGFIVLAWTGGLSEELFFRGHLTTALRSMLGDTPRALVATTLLVAVPFALLHGYQGWSGVLDTGLYGGVTLTVLFLWRRRLTACIVAHASWNTLATIGIYFWY